MHLDIQMKMLPFFNRPGKICSLCKTRIHEEETKIAQWRSLPTYSALERSFRHDPSLQHFHLVSTAQTDRPGQVGRSGSMCRSRDRVTRGQPHAPGQSRGYQSCPIWPNHSVLARCSHGGAGRTADREAGAPGAVRGCNALSPMDTVATFAHRCALFAVLTWAQASTIARHVRRLMLIW